MNDHDEQLARILIARYDWGWYGITGEQLLSPDSQTICSPTEAARIEGILDDEVVPQS